MYFLHPPLHTHIPTQSKNRETVKPLYKEYRMGLYGNSNDLPTSQINQGIAKTSGGDRRKISLQIALVRAIYLMLI